MSKTNKPMWIIFGVAMALAVLIGALVGCGADFTVSLESKRTRLVQYIGKTNDI